ncbi:MAG: SET domain-containing protein-lysine N-methyltransferase [Nanoarchaeota archaeon]
MDLIIKESIIKGKGVFAARDFKKGETVIVWHPESVLSKSDFQSLSEDEKAHATYAGNGKYLVQGSPERFVNHSCEPNTYTHGRKDIALRDIRRGEEITGDYALNGVEDWTMECNCASKNCRKIIYGDFLKLDDKTRKRLEPYLEDWYKEEFNNLK